MLAGETLGDVTGRTPNAGAYDPFVLVVGVDGTLAGAWHVVRADPTAVR